MSGTQLHIDCDHDDKHGNFCLLQVNCEMAKHNIISDEKEIQSVTPVKQ